MEFEHEGWEGVVHASPCAGFFFLHRFWDFEVLGGFFWRVWVVDSSCGSWTSGSQKSRP